MYTHLNLTGNPFKDNIPKPGINAGNKLFWAGQERIKQKIGNIYNRAFSKSHKQIILNWGPYGGGKTFTADYFINTKFDDGINITQIYLRSPKTGNIAGKELLKNIIDYLIENVYADKLKTYLDEYKIWRLRCSQK